MILESDVLPVRVNDFAAGTQATFGDIYTASRDQALYAGNSDAQYNAELRAYDERIRAVFETTGIKLQNPRGVIEKKDMAAGLFDQDISAVDAAFAERLSEIALQHPQHAMRIRPDLDPRDEAKLITQRAEYAAGEAVGSRGIFASLPGMLSGGFVGTMQDPLQVLSSLVGGGAASVGRTALTSIVRSGAIAAGTNAATSLAIAPVVQGWRSEAGLESGVGEAAKDAAWAAVFGGVLGGGLEAGGQIIGRVTRGAPEKPVAPDPATQGYDAAGIDATIKVADRVAEQMTPEARAALSRLKAEREAEGLTPAHIDVQDHLDALSSAERFLDDPEAAPPVRAPDAITRADGPAVDDANAATFGGTITIGGKPAAQTMVRAADLRFDPERFQYKGGGDAQGVTEKLRSVKQWDQSSAGWVYAFEALDGTRYVADGHQRTGLAQRLMKERRAEDISLPAFVFREADGWTPSEVRARAAQKNIREGTGDVVDTATVIREKPTLLDRSLPLGTAHLRQAIALSRLSPEAFGMVRAGVIAPHLAQAIGEQAASAPVLHRGLAEALVRQDVATADQARLVVAAALRIGAKDAEARAQGSLFGDDFFAQTHIVEQAKVLDGALKKLSQDARLFKMLSDKGDTIEAKGNVLASDVNARTAELSKIAGELIEKLARTEGPVADIVDVAARAVATKEMGVAKASDQVVSQVIDLFEREGLNGVMNRRPPLPAVETKPAEPGTVEAVERAEVRLPPMLRMGAFSKETTPLKGTVFHDTSGESAAALIMDDLTNAVDGIRAGKLFVTDNQDIAIGQSGSGIMLEFDGAKVSGVEHKKPGTGDFAGREYQTNALANNAITAVTVAPGQTLELKPSWQTRFDATFKREDLPDGSQRYTRKETLPKEITPAAKENNSLVPDQGAEEITPSLFDMMPADGENAKLQPRDLLDADAKREDELAKVVGICNRGPRDGADA